MDLRFRAGDVVEGECRLDKGKASARQGAHVVTRNEAVIALRIESARFRHHLPGNVDAHHLKTKTSQEPAGAAGAATEIKGRSSLYAGTKNLRQVAEGEMVGVGEFEFGIGFGAGGAFVTVDKVSQRQSSRCCAVRGQECARHTVYWCWSRRRR